MDILTLTGSSYIVPVPSASLSWSKESIIALITIVIMVTMSGLGFCLKHRSRALVSFYSGRHYSNIVAMGMKPVIGVGLIG
jgi:hypothetical protein